MRKDFIWLGMKQSQEVDMHGFVKQVQNMGHLLTVDSLSR